MRILHKEFYTHSPSLFFLWVLPVWEPLSRASWLHCKWGFPLFIFTRTSELCASPPDRVLCLGEQSSAATTWQPLVSRGPTGHLLTAQLLYLGGSVERWRVGLWVRRTFEGNSKSSFADVLVNMKSSLILALHELPISVFENGICFHSSSKALFGNFLSRLQFNVGTVGFLTQNPKALCSWKNVSKNS